MSQTTERRTEEEDVAWSVSSMEVVSLHQSHGNSILTSVFTDCHDDVLHLPSSSIHSDLKMFYIIKYGALLSALFILLP